MSTNTHYYQDQYWQCMTELYVHIDYLRLYHDALQSFNTRVNALAAVVSSTSIAAWAAWREWPMLWASIVCLSQVVTAVLPAAPRQSLIGSTQKCAADLQVVLLAAEKEWYSVFNGQLSNQEINAARINVLEQVARIKATCFEKVHLPLRDKLRQQAMTNSRAYFRQNYPDK
jgi:hypothetical protein